MKKITINNFEIASFNNCDNAVFPKYTSQLINWANQNAQGTRPKVVGQLSDLFPEYVEQTNSVSVDGWSKWYLEHNPNAIDTATDKIVSQLDNLKEAIKLIDRDMVQKWVEDLVIYKTYNGLYVQEAILSKLAELSGKDYRLATPEEESRGIDGYVGDTPYSIKPESYKTMDRLSEIIDVKMVYYSKKKTGLSIEVDE